MITLILHFASDTNTYTKHTHWGDPGQPCARTTVWEENTLWYGKSRLASSFTSSWDDYTHGKRGFRLPPTCALTDASALTNVRGSTHVQGQITRPHRNLWITVFSEHIWEEGGGKKTSGLTITCLIFILPLPFVFLFICALKCCASWNLRSGCTYFVLITNFLFV